MTPDFYLSIVIPAYNEERRLPGTLDRIIAFLRAEPFPAEVIVVDDGSRDRTAALAQQRMDAMPPHVELRVISYAPNQGKGAAVRRGCLAARGKYVVYTDADLPTPVEEVRKLLAYLSMGYDLAIGNRIQPDGSDMRASQPPHRRVLGKLYHLAVEALAVRGIADTQCGFKALTREAAQALCSAQHLTGWVFDTEILYLAQRWNYRIAQVPITWSNVGGSRMRVTAGQAVAVLRDLVSIRWQHRHARPPRVGTATLEDPTR
ncbi:MAG: glycosyltransferase family 2 protein [Chloroflexi bacterium]|nr:glycosyltransferase family 2 protein [Chloroflexota bacterium]